MTNLRAWLSATVVVALLMVGTAAQTVPSVPLVGQSAAYGAVTVTTVADGLEHPWSLAFLPDGNMLVTERAGRLRVIRNGVLDPTPIPGLPAIYAAPYAGLMDVILHPDFAKNQFVYLTYNKSGPTSPPGAETMGARLY